MRNFFKIIAIVIILYSSPAHAASVTATATAIVISDDLLISAENELDFGKILSASSGGTLTITPNGHRISSAGVNLDSSSGFEAAKFNITGQAGYNYSINLPSHLSFIKEGASSIAEITSLNVSNFTSYSQNANSYDNMGTINNAGSDVVYVGAILHVPTNAQAGRYRGIVPVTVAYY